MYALISVYDDTNKSICESKVLLPDSVETTEYSDETYTKHQFLFTVTTSKTYPAIVNGKFKHDDIPEPEVNKCMVCGRIIHDNKAICDKCYEIAKKEGLLI